MAFKTNINVSKPLPYVHNPIQKTVDKVNESVPLDKPQKNKVDLTPKGLSPSVNKAYNNILGSVQKEGTNPTGSVSPLGGYSPKSSVVSVDKPAGTVKNSYLDTAVDNIMSSSFGKSIGQKSENNINDKNTYVNQYDRNAYKNSLLPNGTLSEPDANSVRVVDYLNSKPDAHVTWDNELGQVLINGVPVPKEKVFLSSDGRSYVSRELVDSIYDSTVKNDNSAFENNVQRYDDVYDKLSTLSDKISSPEDFEYDARNDPLFKVYSDYYDKLGEDAFADTLAQLSSRTGGYVNSHAIAAASHAKAQWDAQKANIIPTLEEMNYNRHIKDRETDNNAFIALGNIFNTLEQGRSGVVSDANSRETERELGYYGVDLERNAQAQDLAYKYAVLTADTEYKDKVYELDKLLADHQITKDTYNFYLDKMMTEYQTGKPYYKPTTPKTTTSTSVIDTSTYFK